MGNPFRRAAGIETRRTEPTAQRNAFAAAAFSRLNADWIMAARRSADTELRYELRIMRDRARELDRNSPFGARYSTLISEKVIGPEGIQLKAKNKLKDGTDLHRGANKGIQDAWLDWSRPENCDVTGKLSLTEMLSLAAAQWGTDGEILFRKWEGPQFGPYGFQLQLLDPDLLDETYNQESNGAQVPLIRQGVEYDSYGKPTAYWLWTAHPADPVLNRRRIRVPADQIIHTFIPRRVSQSRGIPHTAAIMATLKMLDGYVESESVAARIASATFAAIEDLPNGDTPAPTVSAGASANVDGTDGSQMPGGQDIPMEMEPGAFLDLRGRGKLSMVNPLHPTTAFASFLKVMSHYAAMGLSISYGSLTGDLSDANYGSQRVGMLDEQDHWRRFQQFFVIHVLDRVYRSWLKMALLNQMVRGVTDFDARRWTTVLWKPRGFPWIDPLKDVQGELIEVAAGVNSLTRMCGERGIDFEEICEERAEDNRLLSELGLVSILAIGGTGVPADGPPEQPASTGNADGTDDADGQPGQPNQSKSSVIPLSRRVAGR